MPSLKGKFKMKTREKVQTVLIMKTIRISMLLAKFILVKMKPKVMGRFHISVGLVEKIT